MAEIVLITGKPGAGKTAHMVHMMLHDPIFKNENGELRKVFANIKGLELPHIEVSSIQTEQAESTDEKLSFHDAYKWIKQPENLGSILIIDEVQDVYPSRSNGSKVPENVSWLNTHRHLGVDIFVLTQDPKDIDSRLRNLVNKHYHIAKNKMRMRTLLEWKYCANNPIVQAKDAFAKLHKIDDNVKNLYKSAELHTENTEKVSKWVYAIPILLVILPIALYFSYTLVKSGGGIVDNTATEEIASEPTGNIKQQIDAATALQNPNVNTLGAKPEDWIPRLAERPETKPIYDSQRQVVTMEYPVACVQNGKNCNCYSSQATKIKEITIELCNSYVNDGMPFNPYKQPNQQQQQPQTQQATATTDNQILALGGGSRPNLQIDPNAGPTAH